MCFTKVYNHVGEHTDQLINEVASVKVILNFWFLMIVNEDKIYNDKKGYCHEKVCKILKLFRQVRKPRIFILYHKQAYNSVPFYI